MTPKEKALELVEKMAIYHWTDICDYEGAKQCALIAVDEILIAITFNMYDEDAYNKENEYWNEVRNEILNL